MENINLSNGYNIMTILKENKHIVEKLCDKCSDYYILHNGVLPSKVDVEEIFRVLPPNKSYEDKFVLGIYKFNELIGIVDMIRDWPTKGEWMLGLMVIDPEERENGLGKRVHKELVRWAKNLGAKSFRIGVIEENYKGMKFWCHLGYKRINRVNMEFIAKQHIVNVMRLKLFSNNF